MTSFHKYMDLGTCYTVVLSGKTKQNKVVPTHTTSVVCCMTEVTSAEICQAAQQPPLLLWTPWWRGLSLSVCGETAPHLSFWCNQGTSLVQLTCVAVPHPYTVNHLIFVAVKFRDFSVFRLFVAGNFCGFWIL